jgi:DNA-binding Lrp family transcriptional regulator
MADTDFRLVQELAANARSTYRELGEVLGLSANAVHKRVQALVDAGIISRFTVSLTPTALPQLWVRISGQSTDVSMDEAVKRLGDNPNTSSVGVASGNFLRVTGVLRDVSGLNRYVSFVIREGRLIDPEYGLMEIRHAGEQSQVRLTGTDYRILASLQENSRKQISDVALELGISAKMARRRLARMEKNKLVFYDIRYYHPLTGDITTIMHMYLKLGQENTAVAAAISGEYRKNIIFVRMFSTVQDLVIVNVWTKTTMEMKVLLDSMYADGFFEKIVPHVAYDLHYFDTWCDEIIRENASLNK